MSQNLSSAAVFVLQMYCYYNFSVALPHPNPSCRVPTNGRGGGFGRSGQVSRPCKRGRRPRLGFCRLSRFFAQTLARGCPLAAGVTVSAETGELRSLPTGAKLALQTITQTLAVWSKGGDPLTLALPVWSNGGYLQALP